MSRRAKRLLPGAWKLIRKPAGVDEAVGADWEVEADRADMEGGADREGYVSLSQIRSFHHQHVKKPTICLA